MSGVQIWKTASVCFVSLVSNHARLPLSCSRLKYSKRTWLGLGLGLGVGVGLGLGLELGLGLKFSKRTWLGLGVGLGVGLKYSRRASVIDGGQPSLGSS